MRSKNKQAIKNYVAAKTVNKTPNAPVPKPKPTVSVHNSKIYINTMKTAKERAQYIKNVTSILDAKNRKEIKNYIKKKNLEAREKRAAKKATK